MKMLRTFASIGSKAIALMTQWPPFAVGVEGWALVARPRLIQGARRIQLGRGVKIGPHAWLGALEKYYGFEYSPSLKIGAGTQIGRYACITTTDRIEIGRNCLLSEHVYISDHAHGMDPDAGPVARQALVSKGPVLIGDNCFIGYRACILPGVVLGRNCVVGANSVVTRSFDDYSMVAGAPARVIKKYSSKEGKWIPASDA
jgi:acetyltransferase-like isoleucine patch superfamily enzyme